VSRFSRPISIRSYSLLDPPYSFPTPFPLPDLFLLLFTRILQLTLSREEEKNGFYRLWDEREEFGIKGEEVLE